MREPAFYDDGTGLCFWCPSEAVAEMFGVPLCTTHYEEEEIKLGRIVVDE